MTKIRLLAVRRKRKAEPLANMLRMVMLSLAVIIICKVDGRCAAFRADSFTNGMYGYRSVRPTIGEHQSLLKGSVTRRR